MTGLYIALTVLGILLVVSLIIAQITYRIAFHSPDKHQNDIHYMPPMSNGTLALDRMHEMIDALDAIPYERVTITSYDGHTLSAHYIHVNDGAPCAICCHGYRGTSIRDFSGGAKIPLSLGHNVLLIDQRGCRDSGAHAITFGIKERYDVFSWIHYLVNRFGNIDIMLFGVSMGAATVLLTAGMDLPSNVTHIVADSPYTSPKEIIAKVCREDMHIPAWLAMPFLALGARVFANINILKGNVVEAVKHSPVNILLIHGEGDSFVPTEMSRRIADAAPDRITLHTFPNAPHALSYVVDKDRYERIAKAYLSKNQRR